MRCPRCGVDLKHDVLDGVQIDVCSACSGIWLDEGELVQLLRAKRKEVHGNELCEAPQRVKPGVPKQELDSVELCPRCQARLNPVNYDYMSGIVIDWCPNEHGVWLDANELAQLREHRIAAGKKAAELGPELLRKLALR